MKTILPVITLLLSIGLHAQRIDSTEQRQLNGPLTCDFTRTTENGKTSYAASISFHNDLNQFGLIILHDQKSVDSLISDLKGCQPYMKIGRKASITYDRARYQLSVYDFSLELTLYDRDGRKTNLSKKEVEHLIEWLQQIKFP